MAKMSKSDVVSIAHEIEERKAMIKALYEEIDLRIVALKSRLEKEPDQQIIHEGTCVTLIDKFAKDGKFVNVGFTTASVRHYEIKVEDQ